MLKESPSVQVNEKVEIVCIYRNLKKQGKVMGPISEIVTSLVPAYEDTASQFNRIYFYKLRELDTIHLENYLDYCDLKTSLVSAGDKLR